MSALPNYVVESVEETLRKERIENYQVSTDGKSSKNDGYATDIFFLKVDRSNGGQSVDLRLAVKVEKFSKAFGDPKIVVRFYERESCIYSQIFPTFRNFFTKTSIDYIPKCYNTLIKGGRNIVIFENLRHQNYVLHDRLKPLNRHHLEALLKRFAHFHALSFAFKDQNPKSFHSLVQDYDSMSLLAVESEFGAAFDLGAQRSLNALKGIDAELAGKFEKTIERGARNILRDLLREEAEESVFTHGDCWCNNFLFKYDDNDKEIPSQAMILDWQVSSFHSPAIDVAHLLFLSSSTKEVKQFDELLKFYHKNLSGYISDLGSNPEKLFPYNVFIEHWKKYSVHGLFNATGMLERTLTDPDEQWEMDKFEDGKEMVEAFFNTKSKYRDVINERLLALTGYYYQLDK